MVVIVNVVRLEAMTVTLVVIFSHTKKQTGGYLNTACTLGTSENGFNRNGIQKYYTAYVAYNAMLPANVSVACVWSVLDPLEGKEKTHSNNWYIETNRTNHVEEMANRRQRLEPKTSVIY